MNTQEQIQQIIDNHEVVLFMKGTKQFPQCGFSGRAVQLLKAVGCNDFFDVNVLADQNLREGIKVFSDWPTIPQLYVRGEFIGGSDIMMEMFESSEFQQVLANQH